MTKLLANTVKVLQNELMKLETHQGQLSIEQAEADSTINYLRKCLKGAEKNDGTKIPAAVLTTLSAELSKSEERREVVKASLQECEEAVSFLKKSLKGASRNDA